MKGQLRSHKMFAKSAEKYMSLVDSAKIYSTSAWNGPAEVMNLTIGNQDSAFCSDNIRHVVIIDVKF